MTLSHRTVAKRVFPHVGDTSAVCLSERNSSFVLEHTGTYGHCSLNHLLLRGEVAPESHSDICSIALATQKQIKTNTQHSFPQTPVICLDGIFTRVADSDRSFLALEADPLDPLVVEYGSVTYILPPWRTEMPCLKNPCQK